MSTSKAVVNLYEYEGLGLIVKMSTGVIFTNQVGGLLCEHPAVEGLFVPLPETLGRPECTALERYLCNVNGSNINEDDARQIDAILARIGFGYLTIDRSLMEECTEAWLHVILNLPNTDPHLDTLYGFESRKGVLTWENSD